jgi:tetratricopeptide (TPR) repeat protein
VVVFLVPTGARVSRPLKDVAVVTLAGSEEFNRGEELLQQGKAAEAAEAYAAVEKAASGWRRNLLRCRLVTAFEAAGQTDQAVKYWLDIADAAGGSRGALDLRPTRLAPAGSAANDRAIAVLAAKLPAVKEPAYQSAVRGLLADLYQRQGKLAEAQAVLGGQPGAAPATAPKVGQQPAAVQATAAPTNAAAAVQLKLAELSLQRGQYGDAVARLAGQLNAFSMTELASALSVLAKAQVGLAKAEGDPAKARLLLLEAGLNFMRVATFFPAGDEAPGALVGAGDVNERLGNLDAARGAYAEVIKKSGQSPAGKAAYAALQRLEEKDKPKDKDPDKDNDKK